MKRNTLKARAAYANRFYEGAHLWKLGYRAGRRSMPSEKQVQAVVESEIDRCADYGEMDYARMAKAIHACFAKRRTRR